MTVKIAIGAALAAAAALGAILTNLGSAEPGPSKPFSPDQTAAIETIVEDYIRDHPEALIESVNAYAAREQENAAIAAKSTAADNIASLISADSGHVMGKDIAKANVAVIEFFDYHCGFCKRASDFVRELAQSDPSVKVSFREYPILREESAIAASYALAARDQNKYPQFHFALMNASGTLTEDRIHDIAKTVGLDVKALEARQGAKDIGAILEANSRIAADMRIDGTPAFIVASLDGEFVEIISGYRPDDVKAAIKEAKKKR